MFQSFALVLYSYLVLFITLLAGTLMFTIVSSSRNSLDAAGKTGPILPSRDIATAEAFCTASAEPSTGHELAPVVKRRRRNCISG